MEAPDPDENASWKAALVIMLVVAVYTSAAIILGIDPFTTAFDIFIVYLPTAFLIGGYAFQRSRRAEGSAGHATS